jgi:Na+-driven multidrug efflux pump
MYANILATIVHFGVAYPLVRVAGMNIEGIGIASSI